eukprot:TRINITY_DN9723_c0_g1_i1.p1 TRINITY_DN9723_c0_g1~~TRINITY_DN9723_c0_g1_i1.p1  ORF type:complete len:926 (+),score=208.18 TRINITY_DN9723_c0_g1_i1:98-2875(+)
MNFSNFWLTWLALHGLSFTLGAKLKSNGVADAPEAPKPAKRSLRHTKSEKVSLAQQVPLRPLPVEFIGRDLHAEDEEAQEFGHVTLGLIPEPLQVTYLLDEPDFKVVPKRNAIINSSRATDGDRKNLIDFVFPRAQLWAAEPKIENLVLDGIPILHFDLIIDKNMTFKNNAGRTGELLDEAYELEVSGDKSRVVMQARTSHGLFNAMMTFRQLLCINERAGNLPPGFNYDANEKHMPSVHISDAPAKPWRGFLLDVTHHFFNVTDIKKMLFNMALFKMNRFHWHLTDDAGWRIPLLKYPKLLEVGANPAHEGDEKMPKAPEHDYWYNFSASSKGSKANIHQKVTDAIWERWDLNGDGLLTLKEIQEAVIQEKKNGHNISFHKAQIEKEEHEFYNGTFEGDWVRPVAKDVQKIVHDTWDKLDANTTDITALNFMKYVAEAHMWQHFGDYLHHDVTKRVFKQLDKNGDGTISDIELRKAMVWVSMYGAKEEGREKPRETGGHYTREEIIEVMAYAARLHIEVIPEADIPGHSRDALNKTYPEVLRDMNSPEVVITPKQGPTLRDLRFVEELSPKMQSVQFFKGVIDDITSLVNSSYFHVGGGDEMNTAQWYRTGRLLPMDDRSFPEYLKKMNMTNYSEELDMWQFLNKDDDHKTLSKWEVADRKYHKELRKAKGKVEADAEEEWGKELDRMDEERAKELARETANSRNELIAPMSTLATKNKVQKEKEASKQKSKDFVYGLDEDATKVNMMGLLHANALDYVKSKGKQGIIWDEGTIVMLWRSWLGMEKLVEQARSKGLPVVIAAQDRLHLDTWQDPPEDKELRKYDAIGGFTSLKKVWDTKLDYPGTKVLGAQVQLWSEYIRSLPELEYHAFPRAMAMAEITWAADHKQTWFNFKRRVLIRQRDLEELNVEFHQLDLNQDEDVKWR